MDEKLERMILDHREALDADEPDVSVWQKLDKTIVAKMTRKKRNMSKSIRFILLGTVVIAVLVFGYFYLQKRADRKDNSEIAVQQQTEGADPYSQQLNQLMAVVKSKEVKLKEIETRNPVLYKKFVAMLEQLINDYMLLEKELETTPNRQQLMEAMLQNLGLQQDLLNQQLSIYQNIKKDNNESI